MLSCVVVGAILLKGFALLGIQYLENLDWPALALIAFALRFYSTVCVVKSLDEKTERQNRNGTLAVGILVKQAIVAVIFFVAANAKIPRLYTLSLMLLVPP